MEKLQFQILPAELLKAYLKQVKDDVQANFELLQDSELSTGNFSFYTSISAVFSSKIEGEQIELDSFIKHKKLHVKFLPDYTQKIDDLYEAYQFAKQNALNQQNVEHAHTLLTKHILQKDSRGRNRNVICLWKVQTEIEKLYRDIDLLLNTKLSFAETLFFAALIHLVFVKIHPFEDGNGRTARLLEKWFLAQKLGDKAWYMQSEKYYYDHHQLYYANIRLMGLEYDELDYA